MIKGGADLDSAIANISDMADSVIETATEFANQLLGDLNRVDLSEWGAILASTGNLPNAESISLEALPGSGSTFLRRPLQYGRPHDRMIARH